MPVPESSLTVDQALLKLTELSTYSFADFLTVDEDGMPELNFEQAKENGALQAVRKFTVDRYGKVTIELYSVLDILQMILRVFGKISNSASGIEGVGGAADLGSFAADELVLLARKFEESLTAPKPKVGAEAADDS